MFHGSAEFIDWAVSPVKFFVEWITKPFEVLSSHI